MTFYMMAGMSNQPEVDDIQLLKRAQGGDTEAFGSLYERYAQAVFRFLYAHLDNRLDAEDLTAEVFLRVWRSLPNYREQGIPFLALLFRVARNALIDIYRRSGRVEQPLTLEDVVVSDGQPDPGEILITKLEHQKLRDILTHLREDYRTVLVLRFLSDLSPDETAVAMGRSTGAVRVLQHRALIAVRLLIKGS
jgi:RNA polymerase sigma-70 factor (ECF subfamily)